ncbi:MAG: hypothetical protein J6L69_03795 [Lachnospiraceae bacterium]|nr:hypothetical protein [Lachnospiraceae bacterium]
MKRKRKKGLKYTIITVIAVFVLFNILWLVNLGYIYFKFASKVEYIEEGEIYHETDQETGVTYSVNFPNYPFFATNIDLITSDGDFMIYPELFGGCEIIYTSDKDEDVVIHFDENMQLIGKDNVGTIDEHREDIERLLGYAYDKWGLEVNEKK